MDLAEIGFKANTSDIDVTDRKLNTLATTGGRVDGTFTALQKTIGVVGAAMAALGAAKLTSDLISYSEAWKVVNNELKTNIDSEKELIETRTKLIALSKATVSDLGATASLYSELYRATREFNTEQETLLNVTGTLNNLFVAGAKDANTQASAIRQLSQALGTGALRGDEYISVTEAAPRVIDALAESLGMAKGEMRDFAATGGITSEILIKALTDYSDTAQELFDKTDKTFDQSIQNAKTNAIEYAGSLTGLGEAVDWLGGGIEDLSENLDAMADAGGALVAVVSLGLTPAIGSYSASLYRSVTAQLLAGTSATRTAGALGVYTTTAATATVATNALGMASKFLLGPWGLLITAIGTAAAVFLSSKGSSDELNKSLSTQQDRVNSLEKAYKSLTASQIGANSASLFREINKLEQERSEILDKITKAESSRKGRRDLAGLRDELDQVNAALVEPTERYNALNDALSKKLDSGWINTQEDAIAVSQKSKAEYEKYIATITGFQTPLDKAIEKVENFNNALIAGDITLNDAALKYITAASEELAALNEQAEDSPYQQWLKGIVDSSTGGQLSEIADEMERVKAAMDAGDLDTSAGTAYLDELQSRADELKGTLTGIDLFNGVTNGAKDALSSIQGLASQGSKEYAQLGVAIQALTAIQAVNAVVNQASGDPYTSFARMTAMVSALASLGVSIGGLSGGFSDSSEENQSLQGLNAWGEKSASIANGIESIESSSSDLVSINTGMLTALESLSVSISSASAQSLQGYSVEDVDVSSEFYDNAISTIGNIAFPYLGDIMTNWLGGSSKTTDSGFSIAGGSLGDLSSYADVDAYVETSYKKWAYGSTKTQTDYADLDEASVQFALVFDSLATSVYEGAIALGMNAEEAEQAINDYNIATTKISLDGLSADEQAAEIEAVFSSIFDGVSGSVIPYLDEFQQVGEGLGDTLSRLSTEVSLTESYADILGFTISDKLADPYTFATIADNLATLTGGLEDFADGLSSFVDSFASDEVKLEISTSTMETALSELGLSLPDTTDGFYELMQGLDATTEAGQEQIAGLLSLTDTASTYYDLLDSTLGDFNDSLSDVSDGLLDAIDDMYGVTEEESAQSLDEALMLAKAGSYDAALALDTSSLAPDEDNYSNSTEFAIAQATTANKMAELAALTGEEKTTAEYQLSESIEQTSLLSTLKEQQALMTERLDAMAVIAKESKDTLLSFDLNYMNVKVVD